MSVFGGRVAAVILAGGRGTRMGEGVRKPARRMLGKPLVRWAVEACREAGAEPLVVVPPDEDGGGQVREAAGEDVRTVVQTVPKGTGHALLAAREELAGKADHFFVLVGDAPAVTGGMLKELLAHHLESNAVVTFASAVYDPVPPYGRVLRGGRGEITGVVEEKDASPAQRKIREVITSQYVFREDTAWTLLDDLVPSPVTGELNLTEVITAAVARSWSVEAWNCPEPERLRGVNRPEEWAALERFLKQQ